ncbi:MULTISPECIES: peptidoglycan-binding protein [unclassified Cedecea]|uniref:peptidoglycan-binding protein n=1 Tax=unclassified Cedecea TaxID=2649846 RepID=UPI00301A70E1
MSKYHEPMLLHPSRLFSSVGTCGTNASEDVKNIQKMMLDAGYQQATGRHLRINGQCGQQTIEAIRWYQRLLNMHPSGLVHPVDSAFMVALENAAPGWRPRHQHGPLRVMEGQITFDAEGADYVTAVAPFRQHRTPYFSRILHWPTDVSSGVTLGRGYDMGNRSTGEVFAALRGAGLEEYKARLCSRAAGLKGRLAGEFVKVYGPLVGEITHQQQIRLFEIAYREKLEYTRSVYSRVSRRIPDAPAWQSFEQRIRDVLVDIFFQGVENAEVLFRAAIKGKSALIELIRASSIYMSYESNRKRLRYLK